MDDIKAERGFWAHVDMVNKNAKWPPMQPDPELREYEDYMRSIRKEPE
jgi:hypothetical protein